MASKKKAAKKASKKPIKKKKAALKKSRRASLHSEYGRPVCRTQNIYLGECMLWSQAKKIAKAHEDTNPLHAVDVESC
jgi:hypothetical protein